jgi:non-specific serine/threonine protein kinase/serine/threonine-protein kinase
MSTEPHQLPLEPTILSSATWDRVKAIFEEVRELAPEERPLRLDAACAGNRDVRREVESLLAWDGTSTDGFLEESPVRAALRREAVDPLIGEALGAYRIVDPIGQGGMGTVYRAVRADAAYEKAVAIKVISPGRSSERVVRQFKRERQALALLDHPGISRIVDGGTTAEGRPYFVMDYVEGVPLDAYCDRNRLTIEQRLLLFCRVCEAVQYAHQRLIVHRDLKPDNILVSADGAPNLLDFGVAKLLDQASDLSQGVGPSHMMTPAFSSPEQWAGAPITTSTDVYSLGVILYVLLCGRRPFESADFDPAQLRRLVCETVAEPPSAVARRDDHTVAVSRQLSPAALATRLGGDLDAIVMRAIQKDPQQRYGLVEQLSDDVRRHLAKRPVSARPATLSYQVGRFVDRQRLVVSASAAAVVLLLIGVSGIVWQARIAGYERARAERRLNDVRHLADSFIFEIHDAIVNIPGTTAVRELMVRRAVEYLDGVAAESNDDPSLQRELAAGYIRIADAQGHPMSANIGDTAGAGASYQKAIAICQALLARLPDNLDGQRTLGMAYRKQADLLSWTGQVPAAVERAGLSLSIWTKLGAGAGATPDDHLQAAIAEIKIGDVLGNVNFPNAGRTADAVAAYRRALPALERLAAASPTNDRIARYLGIVYERLGTMAESARDTNAALAAYERSFAIRGELAGRNQFHVDIQRDLAIAQEKIGNVLAARGEHQAALDQHRLALTRFETLAAADTSNVTAARTVAISLQKVAADLRELHRHEDALAIYRRAQRIHETLAARDPASVQARHDVSEAVAAVARTERSMRAGLR